jgi:transcriptional regulator with XRE-family HTH domain
METRGERIRKAREARGWTQQELAERLGYTGRTAHSKVSLWESNKGPGGDGLAGLVRVLNVNGDWLLTGDGEMERGEPGTEALRLSLIGLVVNGSIDDEIVRALATPPAADVEALDASKPPDNGDGRAASGDP